MTPRKLHTNDRASLSKHDYLNAVSEARRNCQKLNDRALANILTSIAIAPRYLDKASTEATLLTAASRLWERNHPPAETQ